MSETEEAFESADEETAETVEKQPAGCGDTDDTHSGEPTVMETALPAKKDAENDKLQETATPQLKQEPETPQVKQEPETPQVKQDQANVETPEKQATVSKETVANIQPQTEEISREVENEKDTHELLDDLAEATENKGHIGWLTEVGSDLISTASHSVSTFTHSVGEGLSSVLAAVDLNEEEDNAEEEQKEEKKEEEKKDEEQNPEESGEDKSSWYSSWGLASAFTSVQEKSKVLVSGVQEKGKVLVTGGLNALETIGKQTYTILAEGEHGLKKVIASNRERVVLSQVLQEVKMNAEVRAKEEEEFESTRKVNFIYQFDDFQGLALLQALELLSSESSTHVDQVLLSSEDQAALKSRLASLAEYFQLSENESEDVDLNEANFPHILKEVTDILDIKSNPNKLLQVYDHVQELAKSPIIKDESLTEEELLRKVHEETIRALAEVTAGAVHHLLHLGQLLLLNTPPEVTSDDMEMKAEALKKLTVALCSLVSQLSEQFTQKIVTTLVETKERTAVITTIYVEASNSSTYIQEGLRLLQAVMQRTSLK